MIQSHYRLFFVIDYSKYQTIAQSFYNFLKLIDHFIVQNQIKAHKMKKSCYLQIPKYLGLALITLFSLNATAQENISWIDFPDPAFELNGLPWYEENKPDLFRLPKRVQPIVREAVWKLGKSPSGARIRFKSDCTTLGSRIKYPRLSGMSNMHVFGQSGVDLYVNGHYTSTAIHQKEVEIEQILFTSTTSEQREFVLYLPL